MVRRHVALDVLEKGLDPKKPHSKLHKGKLVSAGVEVVSAPAAKHEVHVPAEEKPLAFKELEKTDVKESADHSDETSARTHRVTKKKVAKKETNLE